jgi:hypothetical protein
MDDQEAVSALRVFYGDFVLAHGCISTGFTKVDFVKSKLSGGASLGAADEAPSVQSSIPHLSISALFRRGG